MTKRKLTLRERAQAHADDRISRGLVNPVYGAALRIVWLAGYRAGKREGRATAMEDCGWGAGRRSRK